MTTAERGSIRIVFPFACAGVSGAVVYFLAESISVAVFKEATDIGSVLIPLYFGLIAVSLTAISTCLGWLARKAMGFSLPHVGRIAWGGLAGVMMCLWMDLPDLDFSRWLPYAVALAAGVSVALVFNWAKSIARRIESLNPRDLNPKASASS